MSQESTSTKGKFLRIKDFYSWMKRQSNGANSPTQFYYFNVFFHGYNGQNEFLDEKQKAGFIEKLRFCIQHISFPKINFAAYDSNGNPTGGSTTLDGSNMFGTYTIFGNSYLGIQQKTIKMKILNTQSPIIQKFIYPWMIECLSQQTSYVYPFPRLDMAVKFYKASDMTLYGMDNRLPQFVYYIKGMFPLSIQAYDPNHTTRSGGDNNRDVDFAFNQLLILPNKEIASKFNLSHIFQGATPGTQTYQIQQMFKTYVGNAAAAALGNLVQKTMLDLKFTSTTNNTMQVADPYFTRSTSNSTNIPQPTFTKTAAEIASDAVSISQPQTTSSLAQIQGKSIVNIARNTHKAVIKQISTNNTSVQDLKNNALTEQNTLDLRKISNWQQNIATESTQSTVQSKLQTLPQAVFQYQKNHTDQGDILQPVDQLKTILESNIVNMNKKDSVTINKAKNAQLATVKQGKLSSSDIDGLF